MFGYPDIGDIEFYARMIASSVPSDVEAMAYEAMKEDIPTIELANEVTPGDLVSKFMSDMQWIKI